MAAADCEFNRTLLGVASENGRRHGGSRLASGRFGPQRSGPASADPLSAELAASFALGMSRFYNWLDRVFEAPRLCCASVPQLGLIERPLAGCAIQVQRAACAAQDAVPLSWLALQLCGLSVELMVSAQTALTMVSLAALQTTAATVFCGRRQERERERALHRTSESSSTSNLIRRPSIQIWLPRAGRALLAQFKAASLLPLQFVRFSSAGSSRLEFPGVVVVVVAVVVVVLTCARTGCLCTFWRSSVSTACQEKKFISLSLGTLPAFGAVWIFSCRAL